MKFNNGKAKPRLEYETKPIDCWGKMKELRRKHFQRTWEIHEQGGIVAMGIYEAYLSLTAGFGSFANPSYGPEFTWLMRNPEKSIECFEALEARGFSSFICSSMRLQLGQLFMGMSTKDPVTGKYAKPDFIIQWTSCHNPTKCGQIYSQELNVPYLLLDEPYKDSEHCINYVVFQLMEAIEWIGKVTQKEFNDERFIEATRREWQTLAIYARTCELMKTIPTPIDLKHLWSLRLPLVTMRHEKEVLEFYQMLIDEVKDRVQNRISARGFERKRLQFEGMNPFYDRKFFSYPEENGAIFVAGTGAFGTFGIFSIRADGGLGPAPLTPEEAGIQLRTREDGCRALATLYMVYNPISHMLRIIERAQQILKTAEDWHIDGVVFGESSGCYGDKVGLGEARRRVQSKGIANILLKYDHTDPRGYKNTLIREQLLSFTESVSSR